MITALCLAACLSSAVHLQTTAQSSRPRTYRMGFSPIAPKFDIQTILKGIDEWSKHADCALDHRDVPWKELLSGQNAEEWVKKEVVPLTDLFRKRGFVLACTVDLADGLDRSKESKVLREMGRSIAEPEVQKVYVDYVSAFAKFVKPEYLGLGSEVNLLADNLPPKTYAGIVQMTSRAAARVKTLSPKTTLYVSAQVEWAWGKFSGEPGYKGCERVFKDFPYIQALGVSSYPAFGWPKPEDIPSDYYRKLLNGRKLPIVMVEGGWPSTTVAPLNSDPDKQARWVRKLGSVLDDCRAQFVALMMYADLDMSSYTQFQGTVLPFFATMGLADTSFKPKPALADWDEIFHRPLQK